MSQSKEVRDKQLVNARRACLLLLPVTDPASDTAVLSLTKQLHGEAIADLIEQFSRLDKKERDQIANGSLGKAFGSLGGRPSKKRKRNAPSKNATKAKPKPRSTD